MAQPNVAREPSMEEILASIRRIIESNEPQDDAGLPRSLPPVYAEEEFDEEDVGMTSEMAANDPGHPGRGDRGPQSFGEAAPERSLSLADVAARVRAGAERPFHERTASFQAPAPAMAVFQDRPAERDLDPSVSHQQPERSAPEPQQQVREDQAPAPVVASVAPPQVPVAAVVERAEPQSLPAKIEAAASLMSEEAGAQVSRSFGELAAVFDGIQNRSLEDMAQEMLRPMLQDWLDDNLPTLVERLVREEIERVARGPRR